MRRAGLIAGATLGLGALVASTSFGHNGGPPMLPSRAPVERVIKRTPDRKDKHDKKRRKTTRAFRRALRRKPKRQTDRQFAALVRASQARERAIGLPPKYRNRRSRQETQAAWDEKAKAYAGSPLPQGRKG